MYNFELESNHKVIILRWIARIWSIASIGLILLFFAGEGFDPASVALKDWVGLIFFPTGVVIGMLVAWWNEVWGGGIATMSLLAFYGVYGYLLSDTFPKGWAFIIFSIPGFLFLVYWLLPHLVRHKTSA